MAVPRKLSSPGSEGRFGTPAASTSPDLLGALTIDQVFDTLAIRVNGPTVWDQRLDFEWVIDGDRYRVALANGVLTYRPAADHDAAAGDATLTADRATFMQATLAPQTFAALTQSGKLQVDGDEASWTGMLAQLDSPDPSFDIVLP